MVRLIIFKAIITLGFAMLFLNEDGRALMRAPRSLIMQIREAAISTNLAPAWLKRRGKIKQYDHDTEGRNEACGIDGIFYQSVN